MMNSSGLALAVDLGATHLREALADPSGAFVIRDNRDVDPTLAADVLVSQIAAAARDLLARSGVVTPVAVGIACPGVIDVEAGLVRGARNFRGWQGVPLARMLSEALGAPVFIENDVNAAALGESWRGAGRGLDSLAFIAVGTGIGVGIVIDGRVYRGAHFAAGEVNSLPSGVDDADVESIASGPAIVRRALAANVGRSRDTELTTDAVFAAAASGDPAAALVVGDALRALGRTVAWLIAALDPAVVVVGGGVSRQGESLLPPIRAEVQRYVSDRAPVVLSKLGVDAQLHGALRLALDAVSRQ